MATHNSGEFDRIELQIARERLERMLATFADPFFHRDRADALGKLARICSELDDRLQALSYRREQLAEVRALGDSAMEAEVLVSIAQAAAAVGERWHAEQYFRGAADEYAALGDGQGHGIALMLLAESRMAWGDTSGAVRAVEAAAPLIRTTSVWTEQAEQLLALGGTLRVTTEAGQLIGSLRAGKIEPSQLGTALVEQAEALPDGIHRQLAHHMASMLERFSNLPQAVPQPSEPTAPEQAAADTRTVPELIEALQHSDQKQRRIAALALGLRPDTNAVEPLLAAAHDRSKWVRLSAVGSLGKLKDRRAFEVLVERLGHDRDKDVRRSAATALRLLKDRRAAAELTEALTDESAVAESAAKALRSLKIAPSVDVLLKVIEARGDINRRIRAVHKLAEIGGDSVVAPLLGITEDTTEPDGLRNTALEAVSKTGDRRVATSAVRILRGYTPRPELSPNATSSPRPDLICTACNVIERLGDASMVASLVPLLDDGNPYTRYAAIRALGAVGNATILPCLQELQQSDAGSVAMEEPQSVGGRFMVGMNFVSLRSTAADAVRRIERRERL